MHTGKKLKMRSRTQSRAFDEQSGFSVIQLLVAFVLISIVSAFALLQISSTRASLSLQNSVRQLATYLERARMDAIRRHATTSDMLSSVVFTSNNTYNVKMDFDGTGTPSTRTFTFESSVPGIPPGSPLPTVSFNWRGRISSCTITFAIFNSRGEQSWVDVSDAGDVTVNSNVDVLPTASYATVSTSSDISSTTVVSGGTVHDNSLDCVGGGVGVAGPPLTGTGPGGCTLSVDPSSTSIKKNGGTTANITVSTNTSSTVTVSAPINLQVSPTTAGISAGSSGTFSVSSLNNTRGTFAVNFTSTCTTDTVLVKVTN